jgi:hypothetical protein
LNCRTRAVALENPLACVAPGSNLAGLLRGFASFAAWALVALAGNPAACADGILRNGSFEGSTKYWCDAGDLVQDSVAHGSYCVRLRKGNALRSGSIRIPPGSVVTVGLWARAEPAGSVQVTLCPSNREVAQQTKTVWCKDPRFGGSARVDGAWARHTWTFRIPVPDENGAFLGSTSAWWNQDSWVLFIDGDCRPFWIDGVSVELAGKSDAYAPFSPLEVSATAPAVSRRRYQADANLLQPGEEIEVLACAFNPGATARAVTLRWELLDYEGAQRLGEFLDRKVSIEPGRTAVETAKLKLSGRGLMLARVSAIDDQGMTLGRSDQPLTVLAFPKNANKPNPEERFGSSLRGGPLVKASQRIGLGWTRWHPDLGWRAIQPETADQWIWPDDSIAELRAHGIGVTAVMYSVPGWAKGQKSRLPREMAAWAGDDARWADLSIETDWDRFVKELVKHYGHDGIVYEFANEPDINRWDRGDYCNLALRTYRVVKGADPRALVQVNVTQPGAGPWTMDFLRRGGLGAFDIHTFHNYTTGPLATADAILNTSEAFKSFGSADKEIWFNEGWTYVPTSEDTAAPPMVDLSPPEVAHMIVRTSAELFAAGMQKLITFHNGYADHGKSWWDWVATGTEWWDDQGNPTVAVPVYNVLCDQLGLSRHEKTIFSENAVFHVFEDKRNSRGVVVAWATRGEAEVELLVPELIRRDVMGMEEPMTSKDGRTRVVLPQGMKPSYLFTKNRMPASELAARLLPLDIGFARSTETDVWRAPTAWSGTKLDRSDGNPLLQDAKPLWQLERVWPDDPMKTENYSLMPWVGNEWSDAKNSQGGQPRATVNRNGIHLGARSGWSGTPAQKLAALTFVAPRKGRYSIEGALSAEIWEGRGPVDVNLLKRLPGANGASLVRSWAAENGKPVTLEGIQVELAEGEFLTVVPRFRAMHTAANIHVRDLALRLMPVETPK